MDVVSPLAMESRTAAGNEICVILQHITLNGQGNAKEKPRHQPGDGLTQTFKVQIPVAKTSQL